MLHVELETDTSRFRFDCWLETFLQPVAGGGDERSQGAPTFADRE